MIGQSVQTCQATVSKDIGTGWHYRSRMAEISSELKFNQALLDRVKRLRRERGMTAEQMATALDLPAERYRKYESRSPMPHYLIERFALIVGRDVEYILTGRLSSTRGPRPPEKIAKN